MITNDLIREVKGYTGAGYEKFRGTSLVRRVLIKGFIREQNDNIYFLLIDTQGRLIDSAFNFLNNDSDKAWGYCSYKQRELGYSALKLLYSFKELNNLISIAEINGLPHKKLDLFLLGGNQKGNELDYEILATRKNVTLNNYYFVYRSYFKYLGLDYSIFDEVVNVRVEKTTGDGFYAHAHYSTTEKYKVSKRAAKPKLVPKYIKFEEYENIIELLRSKQIKSLESHNQKEYVINLRAELIVHLMYIYGMRIGEVLGLTLEDIFDSELTGEDESHIIIRNRHTDRPFQYAKGCMKIKSPNDYSLEGYHTIGLGTSFGCEKISIFEETLELIQDYKSASRKFDFLGVQARKNLRKNNIAAKVDTRKDIKENQYLFISSQGKPLNVKTWNTYLREIFIKLGLPVDSDRRDNNLNHKFRHGYAMYKKEEEGHDILQLRIDLRHSSIYSCAIYFNPTEQESGINAVKANRFLEKEGVNI